MKSQHKSGDYVLSRSEVQRIYNAPNNFRDRVLIKSFYFSGLRRFEASSLLVSSVDFNRNVISVFGKGEKVRSVPIIDPDYRADLYHFVGRKNAGFVFANSRGESLSDRQINDIVRLAGSKAEVTHPNPTKILRKGKLVSRGVSPHLFRHSIARHMKSDGVPMELIQNFLGHNSINTTVNVYGTLGVSEMQTILEQKYGELPKRLNKSDYKEIDYKIIGGTK